MRARLAVRGFLRTLLLHWPRVAVTLLPLLVALLHAVGAVRIDVLQRFDDIIYDARLRATSPNTPDPRIVIVDIDEKSLAEVGRWPWGRNWLATLVSELLNRQRAAVVGFDVVFAEADESSGLKQLRQLAQGDLRLQPKFVDQVTRMTPILDYDAAFAKALENRPVVLGYYFTADSDGRTSGVLPQPVFETSVLQGRPAGFTRWSGYGSNLDILATAAPMAGFFNSITERDGVVRAVPLVAEFRGQYYESLSLAMFRTLVGMPQVHPGFAQDSLSGGSNPLEAMVLTQGASQLRIPVDERVAVLVPYRGRGGPAGGSFRYISAADLLGGRTPALALKDKIVLVGTTAPGLLDLRVTPMGETYPGVETHANVISGLLDGRLFVKPDYAAGYEVLVLVLAGLTLAIALPLLSAASAVLLSAIVVCAVVGLNVWLYLAFGQVLPLASAVAMVLSAFGLNMSYGYFVESRSKRELAQLFGTYVPPELVNEMLLQPDSYSMKAASKELTVLFCDMRGFTKISEQMEPTALQALLNSVFSHLTDLIRSNRGTIDKYMGDCVMAFWGAPVDTPDHARLAVKTALQMARSVYQINEELRAQGLPAVGIGIGINTGVMCVGDMGSYVRRSYTVIGDAVNLGARLEGLSKSYAVDIVASDATRRAAPGFVWLELDRVRVMGKAQAVSVFTPVADAEAGEQVPEAELQAWARLLAAYRAQDWATCDDILQELRQYPAKKHLLQLYTDRVAALRRLPADPGWDGTTNFDTK